jgi:hypothetical protein
MNKLIRMIVLLFVVSVYFYQSTAQAFIVTGGYKQFENGSYSRTTKVTCEPDDHESCQKLCGQENECERAEPFCRNCAGTASSLLRQLFTEISKVYKIKSELTVKSILIQYLKHDPYVLLDVKSIFDYYHSVDSGLFVQELKKFCGEGAESSLLAVTLDAVNQPKELKYVLCQDPSKGTQTRTLEVEPRFPGMFPAKLQTPIYFRSY